ncbi:hypothetical protein PCL_11197 [Purpureocillium lilacinum]|uniref:Uncharacterized protein n=1 Tax=Purpureocillium lilacinum TaxID=33203 RepID=A0A2U3EDH4_PURLI|nr:hypothetical protein PCL_11197 [Purpureocillium lilacinum]
MRLFRSSAEGLGFESSQGDCGGGSSHASSWGFGYAGGAGRCSWPWTAGKRRSSSAARKAVDAGACGEAEDQPRREVDKNFPSRRSVHGLGVRPAPECLGQCEAAAGLHWAGGLAAGTYGALPGANSPSGALKGPSLSAAKSLWLWAVARSHAARPARRGTDKRRRCPRTVSRQAPVKPHVPRVQAPLPPRPLRDSHLWLWIPSRYLTPVYAPPQDATGTRRGHDWDMCDEFSQRLDLCITRTTVHL